MAHGDDNIFERHGRGEVDDRVLMLYNAAVASGNNEFAAALASKPDLSSSADAVMVDPAVPFSDVIGNFSSAEVATALQCIRDSLTSTETPLRCSLDDLDAYEGMLRELETRQ